MTDPLAPIHPTNPMSAYLERPGSVSTPCGFGCLAHSPSTLFNKTMFTLHTVRNVLYRVTHLVGNNLLLT